MNKKLLTELCLTHGKKCPEENKINSKFKMLIKGGTYTEKIQLNGKVVITGGISIPIRYIQKEKELCFVTYLKDCVKLSVDVLESEIIW